ncbi:MAG TPA: LLM class flavin-dependent oxidoreductase [Xanthobacteraceae bacterium]|jgi:alkanesulfonate monooxygenase SsuD/methylene tetrahydromethanopterin reductase-like flavin-dependent oxidoreductase (luciferase family)|nr:LLM class flavin-dependent oxidoreductase [Xanthobacteraceae bacterium]
MRVYQFSEQAYYPTWNDHSGSLRVILPNRKCDPRVAADLFHRYYDEYQLCDELGLDIMLNEHHQTATCMSSAVVIGLAVLARATKKSRLLVLGYPIGHRPDPLRVAEELSTIDVISHGRLDMGFIKGIPYEIPASNRNPTELMDRFWEAHDFIIKAMTTHDGTFNWEGEFFHYRQVNVWPRVWQEPHPPIWSTTGSSTQARVLGERGYVMATLGTGFGTRKLYDAYRKGYVAKFGRAPGADRFAYLGLVAVAHDKEEARKRGDLIAGYLRTSAIVHVPFRNPPGYVSAEDNARLLRGETPPRGLTRDGRAINIHATGVDDLIDAGVLFCGTPDEVCEQIVAFCEHCGGMGNLLMMGQAGFLTHEQTVDNLTLFSREVLPRLKAYQQPDAEAAAKAVAA